VSKNCGKGIAVEGKDIEEHVAAMLDSYHLVNLRSEMRKAGVVLPGDKPEA
jgi:hypothetical protein